MSPSQPPDPRLVALGRAVQQLRGEQRLTLLGLAARVRLTHHYVRAVEDAEISLSYLAMCRLADALTVAPHELVALAHELPDDDGPRS
jgi:transcriptional regulator with XRE-family HTH domain